MSSFETQGLDLLLNKICTIIMSILVIVKIIDLIANRKLYLSYKLRME